MTTCKNVWHQHGNLKMSITHQEGSIYHLSIFENTYFSVILKTSTLRIFILKDGLYSVRYRETIRYSIFVFNLWLIQPLPLLLSLLLHLYIRKIKIKRRWYGWLQYTFVSFHFSHPSLLILLSHSCFRERPLNLSMRLKAPRYCPSRMPCFMGRMLWRETQQRNQLLIKTFWLVLVLSKFQAC